MSAVSKVGVIAASVLAMIGTRQPATAQCLHGTVEWDYFPIASGECVCANPNYNPEEPVGPDNPTTVLRECANTVRMNVDYVTCDGTPFFRPTCTGGINNECGCCFDDPRYQEATIRCPDGALIRDDCGTGACDPWPHQDACDGIEPYPEPDRGCLDDEASCGSALDSDPYPVRYSSGRVETNDIAVFSLPAIAGLSLSYRMKWGSSLSRTPAFLRYGDIDIKIYAPSDDFHFVGTNWIDNMSDKLVIGSVNNPSGAITWLSIDRTVTFNQVGSSSTYVSTTGAFTLVDRGAATPRWIISSVDVGADVHQQWGFTELTHLDVEARPFRIGYLVHRGVTSGPTSYTPFYSISIERPFLSSGDTRVTRAFDTFGRELRFAHTAVQGLKPPETLFHRVSSVTYAPSSTATGSAVGLLSYTQVPADPNVGSPTYAVYLDRIDLTVGYRRFLYTQRTTSCPKCDGLLYALIGPTEAVASPMIEPQDPPEPEEVVLEGHTYEDQNFLNPDGRPRAIRSFGPGGAFAYVYGLSSTTQYDLGVGGTACGAGCATGYECFFASQGGDDKCYVAHTYGFDLPNRTFTGQASSTGGSGGGASSSSVGYSGGINPTTATDSAGIRTTYGFSSTGRLRCLVRNDDDDEAFANPSSPDTSACDPPVTGVAQVVRVDWTAGAMTKRTSSILNPGQDSVTSETANYTLRTVTRTDTGYTRDIDGVMHSETHTSIESYDATWRLASKDGPLSNAAAYDVTDFAYHSTPGTLDYGLVNTVTNYVGTATAHTALTTTYSQYDAFGVPHLITYPGGQSAYLTASTDRKTWTVAHRDTLNNVVGISEVVLNPDGTLRSAKGPDGVCLTYEYRTASGVFIGAPTIIKRSTGTSCGVLPIVQSTGEVELRTYVNDDARRFASITRKMNGTTQFTYSGFTYDTERRLAGASTLDSVQPYSFEFTDGVPTATTAPGGAGAGGWRTETGADAFGRPTHVWRMLNAAGTSKQAYTFEYATAFTPRPTRLIRGSGATQASITEFVYDDFGRLLESSVPEQKNPGPGITRFEYDAAGNLVKERVGVGTALVRTSVRTYDSLGRLLSVDHDTEHPVNCGSAPSGTKIQDEEYRYDSCTGDYPTGTCANTLGRLTISRAVLHCASNQTIKRGKWYSYDNAGRLSSVKYATVTGTTIGTPATVTYAYTSAGRLQSLTSPLSTTYGTKYSYNSSGLVSTVETSATTPSPIASSLTYRAFGPLTGLTTPVTLPGPKTLKLEVTRRSDDAITTLSWKTTGTPTYFINQAFTYTPAGLIQLRDDNFAAATRYYEYDALQRLTCEAKASGVIKVNPSAVDCDSHAATIRTVGRYTYRDGTSANAPPDVRGTAFTQTTGYVNTGNETYTYTGGSGMITGMNRAVGNMTIAHDVIGRRIYDYDNFDATRSRRDYTYLPNGQLASISGQTSSSVAYSVAVNYDTDGRPLTISETGGGQPNTTYELFYDDASHLLAAQITVASATPKYVTWNYHYLASTPLAATRVIQIGTGVPTVKRFWFISDERGLIYRGLDDQGVEYWNATWDATGWRTISTQSGGSIDMWMPFGLTGQLVLGSTVAYANNGTTTHVRSALALNQRRVYDPLLGAFIMPDRADTASRITPEGYLYGRGTLVGVGDASGDRSNADLHSMLAVRGPGFTIDDRCTSGEVDLIKGEAIKAIQEIQSCKYGLCAFQGGEGVRRAWIFSLSSGLVECTGYGERESSFNGEKFGPFRVIDYYDIYGGLYQGPDEVVDAFTFGRLFRKAIYLSPVGRTAGGNEVGEPCLRRRLAHEALHPVVRAIPAFALQIDYKHWPDLVDLTPQDYRYVSIGGVYNRIYAQILDEPEADANHNTIWSNVADCVSCK